MSALKPGDEAPEFALESDSGETIRLVELRGRKVVLYFYPKDDTPGCTIEARGFRDRHPALEASRVVVLGVSPDGAESHREFKAKYDLNFPLLADPDHAVASAYGVWRKKKLFGKGREGILRTTFVIDAQGTIEHVFEQVKPEGHADEILDALAG